MGCKSGPDACTAPESLPHVPTTSRVPHGHNTNNQPPAPPSVVPGAVTAAAVDVGNMTEAERRALLAKLVDAGP